MESIDFFWNVTLPILLMLGGVIVTLLITLLYERGQFRKLEDVSEGITELKKTFDDSVKATLKDFSDKAYTTLSQIATAKVKTSGNPHPPDNPKKSVDENDKPIQKALTRRKKHK